MEDHGKIWISGKFIAIVHDGMMAGVMDGGEASPDFALTNGVKQGCVLAPTLFSMMFSAMLSDAFNDDDPCIQIIYRTDGKLFNQSCHQKSSQPLSVTSCLHADDRALNVSSESETQYHMDKVSAACDNFDLTISSKKIETEVLHQTSPGKLYTKLSK